MTYESSRQYFQGRTDRRYHEETVDEVTHRIRSLTMLEWVEFIGDGKGRESDILAWTLVDPEGKLLFSPDSESDCDLLAELDSRIGDPLVKAAWNHCSYPMKASDDAVKNSEAKDSSDSS